MQHRVVARISRDRFQQNLEHNRYDIGSASADQAKKERTRKAAFRPHSSKGFARSRNQQAHGVEKRREKTELLPVFPRQTGSGLRTRNAGDGWRLIGNGRSEEFREWPPFGHARLPA